MYLSNIISIYNKLSSLLTRNIGNNQLMIVQLAAKKRQV